MALYHVLTNRTSCYKAVESDLFPRHQIVVSENLTSRCEEFKR